MPNPDHVEPEGPNGPLGAVHPGEELGGDPDPVCHPGRETGQGGLVRHGQPEAAGGVSDRRLAHALLQQRVEDPLLPGRPQAGAEVGEVVGVRPRQHGRFGVGFTRREPAKRPVELGLAVEAPLGVVARVRLAADLSGLDRPVGHPQRSPAG